MATILDPGSVKRVLEELLEVTLQFGRAQIETGVDGLTLADHCTRDLCSPETYGEFLTEVHQRLHEQLPCPLVLHICGDTSDRLELLASAGVDCLSLDSKVDFGFARETLGPDYLLMGNVEPTNPLTMGTPETVYAHSQKTITQAGKEGHFFLSSGCIVSDEAPPANMEAMFRAGHESTY